MASRQARGRVFVERMTQLLFGHRQKTLPRTVQQFHQQTGERPVGITNQRGQVDAPSARAVCRSRQRIGIASENQVIGIALGAARPQARAGVIADRVRVAVL